MYETIDDPVHVLASFSGNRVIPHAFVWKGRRYEIRNVNMTHAEERGGEKVYAFAVTDKFQAFNLHFHPSSLYWTLHEVFIEG